MQNECSNATQLTALFGGTFDPIHYGHLKPVTAMANEVGLQNVTLLPNHVPPIDRSRRPMLSNGSKWWN